MHTEPTAHNYCTENQLRQNFSIGHNMCIVIRMSTVNVERISVLAFVCSPITSLNKYRSAFTLMAI